MQPQGQRQVIISFRLEHLLGWGVTVFLCIVPIILWLHLHPVATIHGYPLDMLALGRITGLVGMVMYALNLIFATRLRFLERWFGGLNRVYIAHHLLGGFALIFLSLHPLFLSLRYIHVSLLQAALVLIPNGLTPFSALFHTKADAHITVLSQWAIFFGIIAFWGMVGLLLVTFFIKIPYRVWLFTHKFLGAAFFLAGLHILFITSDTTINGPLKYYIFCISVLGLIAFFYRLFMGNILIRHYRYFVHEVYLTPGNVTHLIMYPVSQKERMSYKPGQFIFVRFLDSTVKSRVTKEWHPFSISSSPGDDYLRLSVKGLGDYTNALPEIRTGCIAEIEGAYGRFSYTNIKNMNQIWVAGGIGITPFLSMAKSLPKDGYTIDLYYSVKTSSELIDWNNLAEIAELNKKHFRVIPYIGDQQTGHLDVNYIEKTSGGLKGKDIFICGPPPMMKSMRDQLKQKSVPGTKIHTEEFGMA